MNYTELLKRLNAWAASINGRYIDLDGFPPSQPYQCHDVLLSLLVSVFGLPIGAGHAAGQGWTDEVWKQFPSYRPQLANHFSKHWGTAGIRAGDVIFWPYGSRGYPWSHIAVAMGGVVNGRVQCVSQNPGATQIIWLDVSEALGYLRPLVLGASPSIPSSPTTSNPHNRYRRKKSMFINISGTLQFAVYELGVPGSWEDFTLTQESANQLAVQRGSAMKVTREFFNSRKAKYNGAMVK